MARVIEIVPEAERTVLHGKCGAKIGYYLREVQSNTYTDYGGGRDTAYWIVCPNCGENVIVSGK